MDGVLPDRLLRVDLSAGSIDSEQIPQERLDRFIGGKALGARYLYEVVGHGVDPLSPENALLLMVGPLTGYLPGDGQFTAITKSPLTGLFLDSYAGGSFGPSFRADRPDHAGILIEGASEQLTVLDLRGETPRLDARPHLAGATVDEVDTEYSGETVVTIGPAGETGVGFATIAADGGDHHAGRGGAGAVMGAKGLKAIVLPTTVEVDPPTAELRALREEVATRFEDSALGASHRASGTLETAEFADALSILPTRGWRSREFEGIAKIGVAAARAAASERERPDDPIPGDFRIATDGEATVMRGGTPISLGANLGLDEMDDVVTLGAACDRLGLDVISAGNALALAMLASDAGRIDRDIAFGDAAEARGLLEEIATRSTPLGTLLAEGVAAAGNALGLDEEIPTVKSMAVPSFDPRGAPAMALAYATSDRGACHRRAVPATVQAFEGPLNPTQTAHAIAAEQDRRALLWCLIVDDVTTPLFEDWGAEWLSALGLPGRSDRLARIGARAWTLTRLFNVREGVDRSADSLPAVFRHADELGAGLDESTFRRTLDRYYEVREWDRAGRPSRRLLERLDLLEIVDDDTPIGDPPLHPGAGRAVTRRGVDG